MRTLCLIVLCLLPAPLLAQAPEALTEDNSWAFTAPEDAFTKDALLDLRSLNEAKAGQTGYVARSSDGMSFVRGDGKGIRFWSILRRVDGKREPSDQELKTFYRLLAKRGVNMVRLFGQLANNAKGASLEAVDEEQIRRFHKHVALAKANGIYSVISPYWSHTPAPPSWKIEGLEKGGSPYALLFTSERFREAYKGWMRELLTRKNPHTGAALKDEPALAIIQVQNEDGLLWYQTQNLPEAQQRNLRKAFGKWLAGKHGSLKAALGLWPKASLKEDSLAKQEAGLYLAWELGQPASGDKARRLAAQIAFLAEYQRAVYEQIETHLRQLGSSHLTSAGNWRTVNDQMLLDVERYSYAGLDVITINRYTGPAVHHGPRRGWAVMSGDRFASVSVLKDPHLLPVSVKQPVGHPFILTENMWTFPNRYIAEGPFLIAAYSSLTGVDTATWSMAKDIAPNNTAIVPWATGKNAMVQKHNLMGPDTLFQFPAPALAFRLGLIAEADKPAVLEAKPPEAMWNRAESLLTERRSFDPIRDRAEHQEQRKVGQKLSSRAFLIGPVWIDFKAKASESRTVDLQSYIGRDTTRSMTDQIVLNHQAAICTVDAPGFQGACGFFKDHTDPIDLTDVTIESANEYAAISVVAMDAGGIADCGRILVQVGTVYRPSGWSTRPTNIKPRRGSGTFEGFELLNVGKGPWRAANTKVTLRLRNDAVTKATLLDANGYARRELNLQRRDGAVVLALPPEAMHVLLHK